MKNKKTLIRNGFTLIEMLAIIIILAVIATITIPVVNNLISNAEKGSARNSAHGLVKAAGYYYQRTVMKNESERKFDGVTDVLPYLDLEGTKPDKGKVYINQDGDVALAVIYNKTCITKYFNTDLHESDDTENCGVYTDFTVSASYVAFGGEYLDQFNQVIKTSDNGFVAVGDSNSTSYDNLKAHGTNVNYDAIIVKYDSLGNITWSKNFGGSGSDHYYAVIEEENCYTAVGVADSNDGDLEGLSDLTAIVVVKYDKNNGNIISKKVLYTSNSSAARYDIQSLIKHENNYYVQLRGRNIDSSEAVCYVIKYDENFNQIWLKHFNDRYESNYLGKMIKTEKNTLLFSTTAQKNAGEITEDIYIAGSNRFSAIFEISMDDGSILGKTSIGGNNATDIYRILEDTDGYIIIGYSTSTTGNFEGLNKGSADAYIAKISKTPDANGIFPLLWLKTYGGTKGDYFRSGIIDGNQIIAAGYSHSDDLDMAGKSISPINAIIVRYDLEGNLINTKVVGGSDTDRIYDIIKNNENYVVTGIFFSKDGDMQNFNYGNGDAVLMSLDKDLNQIEAFNLRPILLSKLPDLVVNYGDSIPTSEEREKLKLYTTNNPREDLGGYCTSTTNLDPNSNYSYLECLSPLNSANSTTLYSSVVNYNNTINLNTDPNNWIKLYINYGDGGTGIEITNLKVKFQGTEAITIKEAVDQKYIEPLVLIGMRKSGNYFFENTYNLLIEGNSGKGNYPGVYIMMKPKNMKIEQIYFDSNKQTTTTTKGSINIYQYANFDISLTKAE